MSAFSLSMRSSTGGWVRSNEGLGSCRRGRKIRDNQENCGPSIFAKADANAWGSCVSSTAARSASNSRVLDSPSCSSVVTLGITARSINPTQGSPCSLNSKNGEKANMSINPNRQSIDVMRLIVSASVITQMSR